MSIADEVERIAHAFKRERWAKEMDRRAATLRVHAGANHDASMQKARLLFAALEFDDTAATLRAGGGGGE